jgi:hypothetical protein
MISRRKQTKEIGKKKQEIEKDEQVTYGRPRHNVE